MMDNDPEAAIEMIEGSQNRAFLTLALLLMYRDEEKEAKKRIVNQNSNQDQDTPLDLTRKKRRVTSVANHPSYRSEAIHTVTPTSFQHQELPQAAEMIRAHQTIDGPSNYILRCILASKMSPTQQTTSQIVYPIPVYHCAQHQLHGYLSTIPGVAHNFSAQNSNCRF